MPQRTRRSEAILSFWFGAPDEPHFGTFREAWFRPDPAFDATVAARFAGDYQAAVGGAYDSWHEAPRPCLALILLFDQLPRNMFRGRPESFATDPRALALARHALERGFDREFPTVERLFFYLPLQHSEDLADQERAVALVAAMPDHPAKAEWLRFAEQHRDIVARFGRFPHRNDILGRSATSAERAWLAESGVRFGTDGAPAK